MCFSTTSYTHDPYEMNLNEMLLSPSINHLFGTDELGRDIFSRVLSGAQYSVQVAAIVMAISRTIGTFLGVTAGFLGGWIDEFISRVSDVFFFFPGLILAMAISAFLGPSLVNLNMALSIVWWP